MNFLATVFSLPWARLFDFLTQLAMMLGGFSLFGIFVLFIMVIIDNRRWLKP